MRVPVCVYVTFMGAWCTPRVFCPCTSSVGTVLALLVSVSCSLLMPCVCARVVVIILPLVYLLTVQVHGEVFRRPIHLKLFSALIGSGYQLALMAFLSVAAAATAVETGDRGSATLSFVVIYAITSFVSGYTSAAYYRSHFYPEPSPQWCVCVYVRGRQPLV